MANIKSPLINNWTDDISRRESNTGLTANAVGRVFSGFNIKKINNDINVDLDKILQPGIFRFESLSEISAGGIGSYPSITKPTGGLSGFIQIMDNRASNAVDGSEVTHIHQIIYPDASIVTASSDLESDGEFTTVAGSAPYERIGVRTSKSVSKFTWTEWKILGGSGGLQPVVLSVKTDRPINYIESRDTTVVQDKPYYTRSGSGTAADPYVYTEVVDPTGNPSTSDYYENDVDVNAKPNVLYIVFGNYHIELPSASSVSTGTKIGVEQHIGTGIVTELGTTHQVRTASETTYSISYTKSTDTSVVLSKSYYTRSGSSPNYVYTLVNNPTGNPNTNNYYERSIVDGNVIADAAIRYIFECVLSNDGTTHTWVLDVDGNHGAAIDLINERITESNSHITRLEEVLVPARGKKLVHITAGTLPSSSTILTSLTTTSKADIDNSYNFTLYDQIYSINLSADLIVELPSIASTFAGGKIVINVYNSTSAVHTFTLKQTINNTEYSSEFKVLSGLTSVFELTFEHTYQAGSTNGVYCWLLNSAAPLNQPE